MSDPRKPGPRWRSAAREKVRGLNRLALGHRRAGRHEAAVEVLLQALELARDVLATDEPGIAILMGNLAGTYQSLGKLRKAELLYRRALKLLEGVLGPRHPEVARTQLELSGLYRRWGDPLAARTLAERSLTILRRALGNDDPNLVTGLHSLARLYADSDHLAEAKPLLLEAHQILLRRHDGEEDPELALCLANLAGHFHAAGNFSKARALYRRLLRYLRRRHGDRHPAVVEVTDRPRRPPPRRRQAPPRGDPGPPCLEDARRGAGSRSRRARRFPESVLIMRYEDFVIQIGSDRSGGFFTKVLKSPAGEGTGAFRFPFSVEQLLPELERAVRQSSRVRDVRADGSRDLQPPVNTPDASGLDPRKIGDVLYRELFDGQIRSLYDQSLGRLGADSDLGLRIKLKLDPGDADLVDLASLPWEYLMRSTVDSGIDGTARGTSR